MCLLCSFVPKLSEQGTPPVSPPTPPGMAGGRGGPREVVGVAGRPGSAWGAREGPARIAFGYRRSALGYRRPASTDRSAATRPSLGLCPAPFDAPRAALSNGTGGRGVGPAGGEGGGWVTGQGRGAAAAAPQPAPGTYPRRASWGREGRGGGPRAPSGPLGGRGGDSDQVRKKCAEPKLVCMAVSRFLKIPVQNLFSEIQTVHQRPPGRAGVQSGVPGYMRGQETWAGRKTGPGRMPLLQLPSCFWRMPLVLLGRWSPLLFHIRMIFTPWSFVQRWCSGPAAGDS
jgi:hypothetical protein